MKDKPTKSKPFSIRLNQNSQDTIKLMMETHANFGDKISAIECALEEWRRNHTGDNRKDAKLAAILAELGQLSARLAAVEQNVIDTSQAVREIMIELKIYEV